jgi:hypothetical protein
MKSQRISHQSQKSGSGYGITLDHPPHGERPYDENTVMIAHATEPNGTEQRAVAEEVRPEHVAARSE